MSAKKVKVREMDLDAFVIQEQESKHQRLDNKMMPDSDKVTITGIFVDDSGSIHNSGLECAMVDGVNLCLNALRGAKGADFYLDVRGFRCHYYRGMLKDMGSRFGNDYEATYSHTPIVAYSSRHYTDLRSKVDEYASRGIPTSVAYAIFTDGLPKEDCSPSHFADIVRSEDFVLGIGICSTDSDKVAYRELFKQMGIKKSMTPKASASEIRHAMNEFSRSVVAGALRAY